MLNFSMYAKIGDPPGERKAFNPLCPTVTSMSVSGGILWGSLELEQGKGLLQKCVLSPSSPSHCDNCKGMSWIITVLLPTLLLKTGLVWFGFFPPKISCFILLDQSLSHSCTMNVLSMTSNSLPHGCVQQWHSTLVRVVFGS